MLFQKRVLRTKLDIYLFIAFIIHVVEFIKLTV